jgi:hypothetical protein
MDRPGVPAFSTLGGSSAKNHFMPAPVDVVLSQPVRLLDAPLKIMDGSVSSVVVPLASLYACKINAALLSVMFSKVKAS